MAEFDLLIRGGTIVDGTRVPRYRSDLAVRGGRVAQIGGLRGARAPRVLDAEGAIVAPGFVDLHTHYDAQIQWDPYCQDSGYHGVTSVALGNCGFGFAPVRPAERERAMQMMERNEAIPLRAMQVGMRWDWVTFPEWLDSLERMPKGVNALTYVPLNPLLIWVKGSAEAAKRSACTPAERRELARLLAEALDAGACGFSYQRLGRHSPQADFDGTPMPTDTMADEDLLALADVLRERDEGFIQLTDAASGSPIDGDPRASLRFIETLAERARRPVLHNAIVVMDDAPGFHVEAMRWLEDCNRRGLRLFGQGGNNRVTFEFSLEHWNLYDSSPAWNAATQGSREQRLRKLSDPAVQRAIAADTPRLLAAAAGGPPADLTVRDVAGVAELAHCVGRRLSEIGASEGRDPVLVMLDLAVRTGLRARFRTPPLSSLDAARVAELMLCPYVFPGVSDGGAHTKFVSGGGFPTDFLSWLVRDEGRVSLEEAHYRLSALPAHAAGFRDRGTLRVGAPADIVVYDLERLARLPDWDGYEVIDDLPGGEWRRIQRAAGYRQILVNGELTFEEGRCTGATPGRLLRHGIAASPLG